MGAKEIKGSNRGAIVWFTGIPNAGKTTLSSIIAEELKQCGLKTMVLDGNVIRRALGNRLGFSKEDRDANVKHIGYIAQILVQNNILTLVAAIAPYREIRNEIRKQANQQGIDFVEVFVRCPVDIAEARDTKGLYKKARRGEMKFFTGISDPYEEPFHAELIVDTDKMSAEESARQVLDYLEERGLINRRKKAIYVLGMHRSGTSALTGVINLMGINIGKDVIGPAEDNVKGFFENNRIYRINEKILNKLNSSYDDILGLPENWWESEEIIAIKAEASEIINQEFIQNEMFCIKDPRNCILLPFWKSVFADLDIAMVFVIALRNPMEVADSLKKRNAFSREKSVILWLDHILSAELYSRGFPRTFVSFHELLEDTERVVNYLSKKLRINLGSDRDFANKLKEFLEPGLKHHHYPIVESDDILRLARNCYEILRAYSCNNEDISEKDMSLIDAIRTEFLETRKKYCFDDLREARKEILLSKKTQEQQITNLENAVREKECHIGSLEESLKQKEEQIANLQNTLKDFEKKSKLQEQQIASLQNAVREKKADLAHIYNSEGWKALLTYYKLRDKIFPLNTKRRLFVKIIFNTLKNPKSFLAYLNRMNINKFLFYLKTSEPSVLEEKLVRKISEISSSTNVKPQINAKLDENITLDKIGNLNFPSCKMPLVSVVIPAWNKWTFTYNCLKSLLENTNDVSYEVILVDNASTDETLEMLKRVKNVKVIRNEKNKGFVEACNEGDQESKGSFILFLNNDTQVTKGWLKSMTNLFECDEKIGAVGAKLVYPDCKLQEAGGIVWNNSVNLACNYGRYDNPDKWKYNYVKEVDYCSAACLLIRKDLFKRIGLFDKEYAPAYCEDTDLAFNIRQLGYKVMYQPKAEIIHFEGTTAGTDTSQGVKQFQVINQKKFYNKWKSVLENNHFKNGENLFLARDRSQNKKVLLFVDHYVPTWDKDAGSVRMYEYLKIFLEMGFKIVFWPDNLYKMEPYTTELQQMGIEVVYGPQNFERYIKDYGKYIDVAYLSRPHIAINYIDHIKQHSDAKIFYDCHDLHFLREQRRAEKENRPQLFKEARSWKQKEFYLMENSDVTVVLSSVEKEIIEKENTGINVKVLPYIQSINSVVKDFEEKKDLIFIGGFAHMPNEDAVLWFVHEIFPLVKKEISNVKFLVIGSHPTEKVLRLKSNDVLITGYVQNVTPYFENAKIFVASLRYGAGLKGKIVQAMSYGLPVVTTSIGAEGMSLEDGEDVLIADEPEEFARKIVILYKNKDLWNKLSKNSTSYVKNNNSPDIARNKIKQLFDEFGIGKTNKISLPKKLKTKEKV